MRYLSQYNNKNTTRIFSVACTKEKNPRFLEEETDLYPSNVKCIYSY